MADDKDIAEEEQGGGKKKLIIIIAAVVLLLIIGGVAAFFLLGGEDETEEGQAEAEEAVQVEEGDPVYHELDPVFVVNLPAGGSAGMLQIAIQVMTRTQSVIDTLSANDPMIRHHLLNLLEQQEADTLLTVEGKEALQAAILELLSEKLAGLKEPGEIKGVYFTQFVMQ